MKFKRIHVTLIGLPPGLLMNQFSVVRYKKQRKQQLKKRVYDPKEEARNSAYMAEIDGKNQLYIPAFNVYTMILKACSGHKIGGRAAKGVLAGLMKVMPDKIPLGTDKYEIDERGVRIQRARVIRARAHLPEWELNFDILYNSDLLTNPYIIQSILEEASYRVGLGDYRPEHSGPFGTYTLARFELEDEDS